MTEQTTATMAYGLSLERINPPPPDATPLVLSQSVVGEINPPTAQDAYTFKGVTTGTFQIVLSDTGQSTCLSLYDPNGAVLDSEVCTNGTAIPSVTVDVTPALNGPFVIVVNDDFNDGTINYNLEVSCLLGNCVVNTPPPTCKITDKITYNAATQTLTMGLTFTTPLAATWNGWLTSGNSTQQMWSQSEPVTDTPTTVTMTQSNVAKAGKIGVLSTLTTQSGVIECSNFALFNTGKP